MNSTRSENVFGNYYQDSESVQQSRWWKDFNLSKGNSDEWVTAYVAAHLARVESPKATEALHKAWEILKPRYKKNEGWDYNGMTPADADGTVWTWLFATTDEFPEPGFDVMSMHYAADDGITTYSLNGPIGKNTAAHVFNGWQISHYCVTAAYALAGKKSAIDYLLDHKNPAGYWYSYWWVGPEYATALTIEALFNKDADKYREVIDASVNWAHDQARKELDNLVPKDFKIALLLKIILCSPHKGKYGKTAKTISDCLLNSQQESGYWNTSAELRQPMSDDTDHEKGENVMVVKDEKKNFATITILDALDKYDRLNFS